MRDRFCLPFAHVLVKGRCAMITERQVQQVKRSFCQIQPVANDVAALFPIRLFELDPSLQKMIDAPDREWAYEIPLLLVGILDCIDDYPGRVRDLLTSLDPLLWYRDRPNDSPPAGRALLWTLQNVLGRAFDAQMRSAWAAAYELLVSTLEEEFVSVPAN